MLTGTNFKVLQEDVLTEDGDIMFIETSVNICNIF